MADPGQGEETCARENALSRRVVVGLIAASAGLTLFPRSAAAGMLAAYADGGAEGSAVTGQDLALGPLRGPILDPNGTALPLLIKPRPRGEIRSEEALSRLAHPQLRWIEPPTGGLCVPYVSQYDGSPFANANCGPASLSMVLGYLGELALPAEIRREVNRRMGNSDVERGASWESLLASAEARRFAGRGLFSARGVARSWTLAELDSELSRANPVLVLIRFPLLPGREDEEFRGDHYSVVVGRDRLGRYLLHDTAYHDALGAYRPLTRTQLDRAWSQTLSGLRRSGLVLQPKA